MDKFVTMSSKKRAPEPEESEPNEKDDVPIEGAKKTLFMVFLIIQFFPSISYKFLFINIIITHIINIIL